MEDSFTSGSFGEMEEGFSKFHDYRQLPCHGVGYSVLYTVLSGERKLFLKALNQKQGATTENLVRLQREYKILEQLYGNEHIVRCIGWREDAEVGPCIVMEYVDGETLTDYLKNNPSNKEKKLILNELLDAVGFIHKHQVVHNDLKPENILVTYNGHNVKLIDFGYADCDSSIDKATGGTKAFASPELIRLETTGLASDIYSLGYIIKLLFPHRFGWVARNCQQKEAAKRYQRVSEIGKAIHRQESVIWLMMAALVFALAILVWQRQDTKSEQIQVEAQPQLNLDSIHQVYQLIYKKYEKTIEDGIANDSLKYIEFAAFHLYDFASEINKKHLEMMPEEEDLQHVFESDYMVEYGRYYQKINSLFAQLPSFYNDVKDEDLLLELEKEYQNGFDRRREIE